MTPRIGIVSPFDTEKNTYACHSGYVRAVESAGGLPILLPYIASSDQIQELLGVLDGIVLSGGTDFDPALYGEPMHPSIEVVLPQRDTFELPFAKAALDRDIPILGICRGLQCLNIAAGGSLYADVSSCLPGARNHQDGTPLAQMAHAVTIDADSRLAEICSATLVDVNSWHHQAVKEVGYGFRVVARAPDGVVEAIESPRHRFVIGVQWHPERLWEAEPASRRLFAALVEASTTPPGKHVVPIP